VQDAATNEDIQHFYVRNIVMPNIIGVLADLMNHGGGGIAKDDRVSESEGSGVRTSESLVSIPGLTHLNRE
jgi:hypothetical protein